MYQALPDPYCYAGTTTLKNIPGLRDPNALQRFETAITAQRAAEPLPAGRLGGRHFQAIHRHLFQDVYRWAGRLRSVRMSKGSSSFCYPEHIDRELRRVFLDLAEADHLRGLEHPEFAVRAAHFLSELNAIHAFRDGNGRTQMAFMALLSTRAGHPLALERLAPEAFLAAMVASFHGDERRLARQLEELTEP